MIGRSLDAAILKALRLAGTHLPARELAAQRAAPLAEILERLDVLRAAGFEIEDRPGFGLRLLTSPDRLIADDLMARLGDCPLVREILVFAETQSTNDLAARAGRQGAPGGLVVFAERQTAGRGRFGRAWDSASHCGLWFSLLLRPELPVEKWPRLTTWAAVALAVAIEEILPLRVAIKWPNDLYLDGKKIAGILAESGRDAPGEPYTALGIGVNVNHEDGDFPDALAGIAGSLRQALGRPVDRPALAAGILRQLSAHLPQVGAEFEQIVREASCRSLLLGRWIQVRAGHSVHEGLAESLDENGHLLLRTADGILRQLSAGEVSLSL